jgi:hypothetical protein
LRGPDGCTIPGIQIAAALQLHQGEEKGEESGFGHKKAPHKAGPEGKGDYRLAKYLAWQISSASSGLVPAATQSTRTPDRGF